MNDYILMEEEENERPSYFELLSNFVKKYYIFLIVTILITTLLLGTYLIKKFVEVTVTDRQFRLYEFPIPPPPPPPPIDFVFKNK